ncbi:cyclic nucleotide-binding-like protein [Phycomyces nitens]|nr:cyclic nucleotide-binding-like protein [Phycomyces nitens]
MMLDVEKDSKWNSQDYTATLSIPPKLLSALREHSLFQRTGDEVFLHQLACSMHLRNYGIHDVIIREGEPAKAMFFLLRGSVSVCSADYERVYATLHQGSCFGEIGILYSVPRTATIIANEKCTVAVLMSEDVATLLPRFPQVEQMLRYEAEERLALLKKSQEQLDSPTNTMARKPSIDRNVEFFIRTSTYERLRKVNIISFFKDSPQEFLHQVSLRVEPRQYMPNELVIQKGDIGTELFFIIEGTVEVVIPSTTDIVVARLSAGDSFGETTILLDTPRAANVRTVTSLEVYVLSRKDFLSVCKEYPELQQHYRTVAESVLKAYNEQVSRETHGSPDQAQTPVVDNQVAFGSQPLAPITASSVCSTTSDRDPTLPNAASILRHQETRKRRPSIAVWTDPGLVAMADQRADLINIVAHQEPAHKIPTKATTSLSSQKKDMLQTLGAGLLGRIVNFLDFADLVRLAAVSRKYRYFLQTNKNVLHQIDLGPYNKHMTDALLVRIAVFAGERTQMLNLSHCFHLTDEAIQIVSETMPGLKSLNINSCWNVTDKSLACLSSNCPRLTSLDLSNCRKITNKGLAAMIQSKADNKGSDGLTHLSLSYCKHLSSMTMDALANYCSNSLEYLNLQRCTGVSTKDLEAWSNVDFPRLHTVILSDCSFLQDPAIFGLVKAAPNLHTLSLSFCCSLSDAAMEAVGLLKNLVELDASYCCSAVSDTSIYMLLQAHKYAPLSLNIRGCFRITDQGLKLVLDKEVRLTSLNITQCPNISSQTRHALDDVCNAES